MPSATLERTQRRAPDGTRRAPRSVVLVFYPVLEVVGKKTDHRPLRGLVSGPRKAEEMDEPAKPSHELSVAVAIGRILRRARDQKGMSERKLAKRMGYSHSSVSDWERGNRVAHRAVIEQYENALGLPHQSLLDEIRNSLGEDWDDAFYHRYFGDRMVDRAAWDSDVMQHYASVLDAVTEVEPGGFTEVTKWVYFIAEDEEDIVLEEHITTVPGEEPLRWRHFDPGARPMSEGLGSIDDLRIKAWCDMGHKVEVLPVREEDRQVRLVAFFLPPVTAQTVSWHVRYIWRGLWNPLRMQGEDEGRCGFRPFTTRGEIILVPPRPEVSLSFTKRDPEIGEVDSIQWVMHGRASPALRWSVDNPRGYLNFEVAMKATDGRRPRESNMRTL